MRPRHLDAADDAVLTINDRTAPIATSWHYTDEEAAPRLVTAYPAPNVDSWP